MFLANKLNKGGGSPTPVDAQFNYVTMLLHGDGTNGAQNNTFLDSSTNNFTITRNGNTTQGSFSPYGSNWSNFFDGTGDYLSIADNAALDMGSSSFTIEGWILLPDNVSAGKGVFGKRANNGVVGGILFYFSSTGVTPRLLADIGGSWGVDITASSGFTLGQWNHFAIVRNSNTWTIYINGTSVGSATNSGTVVDSSAAFTIMAESAAASEGTTLGYISNFRVVKGTAVYTSAFTPSTTPLTAITNTSLLTCQSNRFVDNSANNFTITKNGDTSVQRFNPFGTSTAYSTSVIGGSGYFDGSGDFLTGPTTNSAFDFGSGNWTIDTWAYPTAFSSQMAILISLDNATGESYAIGLLINTTGSVQVYQHGGSYFINSTSSTGVIKLNTWSHIAAVRSGSNFAIFVNGTRVASVSGVSGTQSANRTVNIGQDPYASNLRYTGYLSDLRVVKGTAVYDPTQTTITIPTAPLSAVTNTQLLLSNTNGAIFDNAMMNDLETVGNAQISTSVKKYGTGSLAFDGTGDYLSGPTTPTTALGSGAYTVEFWLYKDSTGSGERGIFQTQTASLYGLSIFADGTTIYIDERTNSFSGTDPRISGTISQDAWIHVAVCRQTGTSGTLRAFVNGTQIGSSVTSNLRNLTSTGPIVVGNTAVATNPLKGYIDDLRITNGYARYTATFTAPTSAFSDTGPY
jgi:hypothetical protein